MIKELEMENKIPLVTKSFTIANNIMSHNFDSDNFISSKKFIVDQTEFNKFKGFLRPGEFYCSDLINTCIQDVSQLVLSHGFSLDVSNEKSLESNCEFHYGISKNPSHIISSPFDIHQDDYGGINCPVITTIIYLDVTCDGGELCFYDNKENLTSKIKTQNPSANTCKVVIFDGSLYHQPAKYSNGKRLAISFQLPRKVTETKENCLSWLF
jgi:hypothetical protein